MFFSNTTLEVAVEGSKDPCWIVAINTLVMGVPIRVTQNMVAETFNMPNEGLDSEREGFSLNMVIPHDNASNLPFHERVFHLLISHFFLPIGSKHTTVRHTDYWFMHLHVSNRINSSALIFQDLIKIV